MGVCNTLLAQATLAATDLTQTAQDGVAGSALGNARTESPPERLPAMASTRPSAAERPGRLPALVADSSTDRSSPSGQPRLPALGSATATSLMGRRTASGDRLPALGGTITTTSGSARLPTLDAPALKAVSGQRVSPVEHLPAHDSTARPDLVASTQPSTVCTESQVS